MATIKDVQLSMSGNKQQEDNSLSAGEQMSQIAMSESTKIESEYIIYKLVDTKRKGRINIDGIDDDVLNPQTKKRERIWLLSGTSSIWSTELTEQLKDKDFVRNNRRSLCFESGILRVPKWDERLVEFIKVCRHLIDNPSRRTGSKFEFFEYNPAKQQEAALAKELLEMDMAIEASKMAIDKARKLASFFGIVFYDELGQPKTDDGIRRELMLFAKREPVKFKNNLDSKEVEIAYLVKKAIIEAKIDLGGASGSVSWAETGALIGKIPASRNAQQYLVELAMQSTDDGIRFKEQLQKVIKQEQNLQEEFSFVLKKEEMKLTNFFNHREDLRKEQE